MKAREKPKTDSSTPSEPIKVIKSDLMKSMLAAMNKHFEENKDSSNEPPQIIECSGGPGVPPPPPPPPMVGGIIPTVTKKENEETTSSIPEPPKFGIPPPPPPPPVPIFDPSKVPKKPKKPVVKKQAPKPPESNVSSGPSLKEQLMKVALKKIGK